MESKEIIYSIHQIFERFKTPKNLQEHMLRAAAIGNLICDNWNGPQINKEDIIAVLLTHDLGNIVKMDFDSEAGLKLLGEEEKKVDYWKQVKKEMIEKYGQDDHIVSEMMAEELEISQRLAFILKNKVFNNNEFTAQSDDWDIKIAAYADQKIGPFGVLTLEERFRELKERYAQKENQNTNNPKIDIFIDCAFQIEKQVLSNTSLNSEDINDESIKKYIDGF
jgi:hypothetical protein